MDTLKNRLAPLCGNSSDFFILVKNEKTPPFPEGLSQQILFDLFDIGLKFGTETSQKSINFSEKTINILIHFDETNRAAVSMIVGYSLGQNVNIGCNAVLNNMIQLFWDPELSVSAVQELIAEVDSVAKDQGKYIDGKRIMINLIGDGNLGSGS